MKTFIHTVDGTVIEGGSTSAALRSLEFKNSLELVVAPKRYLVTWGLGESERELPTFAEALALYIDQIAARGGAKIWNLELCDQESDGLTDEEKEAVELANEMFSVEQAS